jgi:hypothetical protein
MPMICCQACGELIFQRSGRGRPREYCAGTCDGSAAYMRRAREEARASRSCLECRCPTDGATLRCAPCAARQAARTVQWRGCRRWGTAA